MLCFCICFRLIESLVTIHHGARSLVSLSFRSIRADAPSVVSVLTSSLCIPICAHYGCPFNSSIHTMESSNLCRRIWSSAGYGRYSYNFTKGFYVAYSIILYRINTNFGLDKNSNATSYRLGTNCDTVYTCALMCTLLTDNALRRVSGLLIRAWPIALWPNYTTMQWG